MIDLLFDPNRNRRASVEVRRFPGAVFVVGAVAAVLLLGSPAAFAQGDASASAAATLTASATGAATAAAQPATADSCKSEPPIPGEPAASGAALQFDQALYSAGAPVQAVAAGYQPGEQVQATLFGTNTATTVKADRNGTATAVLPLPADALAGTHTIQFTGWCTSRIAVGRVLIGRAGAAAPQLPTWFGWALGGLGLAGLGYAGWLSFGVWLRHRQET